jgi:ribosomal protein S27AE
MNDYRIEWRNIDSGGHFSFIVQARTDEAASIAAKETLERDGQEEFAEIMSVTLITDIDNPCPNCGAEMFEEEDIDGYACPECGCHAERN